MRQVLEDQLRLNTGNLIDHTLEGTSLLALAIGQKYLPVGERLTSPISDQDSVESSEPSSAQSLILTKLDEILKRSEPGAGAHGQRRETTEKSTFPTKRDTILFAAIVSDLEGLKYCSFLDKHRVKPKWSEDGPKSYQESYLVAASYQKKVQDEKSRAKRRMSRYANSVLMDAFVTYLRSEFDQLSSLVNSRNSRDASKN